MKKTNVSDYFASPCSLQLDSGGRNKFFTSYFWSFFILGKQLFELFVLDNVELTPKGNQTNIPEADNNRTYMAMSTLELYVNKSHHGKVIQCTALHETYSLKSASVTVRLDITCEYSFFCNINNSSR